jgi:hypothetical protein
VKTSGFALICSTFLFTRISSQICSKILKRPSGIDTLATRSDTLIMAPLKKVSPSDTPEYHAFIEQVIPSTFVMISAAEDSQHAQEDYNASQFELPNPNGKSGGCCTSALLQVLYDNAHTMDKLTWISALQQMRAELKKMNFPQEPQVTSSRPIKPNSPLCIVPKGSGVRRALLIGINYVGQGQGELKAPHNDCLNMAKYLTTVAGFDPKNCLVLMDDAKHAMPTRANIEKGFAAMVRLSQPNDVIFISFSGHGGQVADTNGDEEDGFDESIIPVDFKEAGQIIDDDILSYLIKPMRKGVHCTLLMDCCHSGTVGDLPYKMGADDKKYSLERGFNTDTVDEIIKNDTAAAGKKGAAAAIGGKGAGSSGGGKPDGGHADRGRGVRNAPLPYNPEDGIPVKINAIKKEDPPPLPPPACCNIL